MPLHISANHIRPVGKKIVRCKMKPESYRNPLRFLIVKCFKYKLSLIANDFLLFSFYLLFVGLYPSASAALPSCAFLHAFLRNKKNRPESLPPQFIRPFPAQGKASCTFKTVCAFQALFSVLYVIALQQSMTCSNNTCHFSYPSSQPPSFLSVSFSFSSLFDSFHIFPIK